MSAPAVVVTGASSGIGAATAARLAAAGFQVFGGVRSRHDEDRLTATGVTPIRLDVTDGASVLDAREAVDRALAGRCLAGLVNNAGIPGAGPIELSSVAEFQAVLDVNLLGALRTTRAFLPLLRPRRGRIVMISSMSGCVGVPFLAPYVASKFALEGFSDCLRRELRPEGIDVIVIQPGPTATPIWTYAANVDPAEFAGGPYETRAREMRNGAMESGRRGLPPDRVAATVERALCNRKPRARYVVADRRGRFVFGLVRRLPDRTLDRLLTGGRSHPPRSPADPRPIR